MTTQALAERCRRIRRGIIEMTAAASSGHPGGSLSCVELLTAAYHHMRFDPHNPDDPARDRFVLSKGHCTPAYYALLADLGFFSTEEFAHFRQLNGLLQGHPDAKRIPGVDASTGSLGQGISIAVGMALGAKHAHSDVHVTVLMGDGELQEGLCWEAFMAASHYRLDNLTVLIDHNGLQIDGSNDEVLSLGDLPLKLRAFGLNLIEVADGNDIGQVTDAFSAQASFGQPRCILAHTVKGKGISFMENSVAWHGKAPSTEECALALAELEG